MRYQPTQTHKELKIVAGEHPAVTARDLYLHARLELAAYLAQHPAVAEDVTVRQRIPSDAELLAERERLAAQGVR
jgi:hypothetical protein